MTAPRLPNLGSEVLVGDTGPVVVLEGGDAVVGRANRRGHARHHVASLLDPALLRVAGAP